MEFEEGEPPLPQSVFANHPDRRIGLQPSPLFSSSGPFSQLICKLQPLHLHPPRLTSRQLTAEESPHGSKTRSLTMIKLQSTNTLPCLIPKFCQQHKRNGPAPRILQTGAPLSPTPICTAASSRSSRLPQQSSKGTFGSCFKLVTARVR
jgi:hypothetical protein